MTRRRIRVIVGLLTLGIGIARPAVAAPTSYADGYLTSPNASPIANPMNAPWVLVNFTTSDLKVGIRQADANQQFNVQVSFYLEKDGGAIDWDTPDAMIVQADANGDWEQTAKGSGVLHRGNYPVTPGNHTATIVADLAVNAGGAPNANYTHTHNFAVNP